MSDRLTKARLADIVEGAGFFGSGGGGSVVAARDMLAHTPEDLSVEVVDAARVAGDHASLSACPIFFGAPAAIGPQTVKPASDAFLALGEWAKTEYGKPLAYSVPGELGAINTLVACLVAADLGIPVVDTDGGGRSLPELPMSTFAAANVQVDPTFLVSASGKREVIHPADAAEAETLARPLVDGLDFADMAGVALWLMDSDLFDRATPIRGTLGLAEEIGRILRTEADPVAAVATRLTARNARVLAQGQIESVSERTEGAFDVGQVVVRDSASGRAVRVDAENENLVAYDESGAILDMLPNLLCFLTSSGKPFSHADIEGVRESGENVVLMRVDADPGLVNPAVQPAFTATLRRIGAPV